jgi:hypothetical protein
LALNSIDPAPPPPAAREAMPAAPADKGKISAFRWFVTVDGFANQHH